MSNDLITPENLSTKLLKSVFDNALMDASIDEDGDLFVKDNVRCLVTFNENTKNRISLLSFFRLKSTTNPIKILERLHTINKEYVVVKAYVISSETLVFKYDIYIQGGITKKNFALAVKFFCSIPREALKEYGLDITI